MANKKQKNSAKDELKKDSSKVELSKEQEYANRVYAGQSVDLNHKERMKRVHAALEAQGMSTEGITCG